MSAERRVPLSAGQGQQGRRLPAAGHPHDGKGAEDVGEHGQTGCVRFGESKISRCGGAVSVESC